MRKATKQPWLPKFHIIFQKLGFRLAQESLMKASKVLYKNAFFAKFETLKWFFKQKCIIMFW